ncbi:MAG TPA: hypothetical protein VLH60_04775 [Sedimentisphaerales bacterium]|nr:hypothetical protein [Sedimentisphaerales bacterium]
MSTFTVRFTAAAVAIAVVCLVPAGPQALSDGRRPDVQVQTEYIIGPAQTDASRAIDIAELVMLQNARMMQAHCARIEAKLDRLAERLDVLDKRLFAIEQHLGVKPVAPLHPSLPVLAPQPPPPPVPPAGPSQPTR